MNVLTIKLSNGSVLKIYLNVLHMD